MKPEYYLYAIYILVLLLVFVAAVLFLYRRFGGVSAKENRLDQELREQERAREKEKEERLFRLYQNIEEMMDGFEAYVQETRDSFTAQKEEITRQLERLTDLTRRAEACEARAIAGGARPAAPAAREEAGAAPVVDNAHRNARHDAVRDLLDKGFTVEQIAQTLDVSINEVKLTVYGLKSKQPR